MIDIHPPAHAATTRRDFFIHLSTVVLGILIAIGLEQSVEYFHHRHLATEARGALAAERVTDENSNNLNIFATQRHERDLQHDLAVLHALRTHQPLPPGPFIVRHPRYLYLQDEWLKVHQSGTINYLTGDLKPIDYRYEVQNAFMDRYNRSNEDLTRAAAVLRTEHDPLKMSFEDNLANADFLRRIDESHETLSEHEIDAFWANFAEPADLSTLSPAQIDSLEHAIQTALVDDDASSPIATTSSATSPTTRNTRTPGTGARMIDIHPPQHAPMTRRDFFVHLGIVVLGILIAIGLEQAVEAVHHRVQRNDLIRQMRTESQHNLSIFQNDQRIDIVQIVWYRGCLSALIHATPHQNSIDVTLPLRQPTPPPTTPEHAAWAIATTNGTVALLSDNLAEVYQRLDLDAEVASQAQTHVNDSGVELAAVSARLGLALDPGATLHLSLADRDLLLQALSRVEADWSQLLLRDAFWQGAADAVAHNVSSRDAIVPYLRQAASSTQQAEIQAGIPVSASERAAFHPFTQSQVHIQ